MQFLSACSRRARVNRKQMQMEVDSVRRGEKSVSSSIATVSPCQVNSQELRRKTQ
jgi:hypothetical protein